MNVIEQDKPAIAIDTAPGAYTVALQCALASHALADTLDGTEPAAAQSLRNEAAMLACLAQLVRMQDQRVVPAPVLHGLTGGRH